MNTKTILGLSLTLAFVVAMIGPVYAGGPPPGWADLVSGHTTFTEVKEHPKFSERDHPARWMISANTAETFTTCPASSVCGIGSFITSGSALTGHAAAMATAAIHDPFCDSVVQDADAAGNTPCDPVESGDPSVWDDADAPHSHVLFFDAAAGCNAFAGVELVSENDLEISNLKLTGTKFALKIPIGDGEIVDLAPEVWTWTVATGTGGEICPVLLVSESKE